MRHRILALCFVLVAVLPPAARADPAYLPPLLSRAPDVGDRWVYAAYSFLGTETASVIVEVVEQAAVEDGWRYLVEDQLEYLEPLPGAEPSPVIRTEWFLGSDGSIGRGDLWVDGELSVDLRAPLLVLRALPQPHGERRRFGHLGWPKAVKRRGWIQSEFPVVLPGARVEGLVYTLRLGDRSRPTLSVSYEDTFGRLGWTDRFGLRRTLVSATVGGVSYP